MAQQDRDPLEVGLTGFDLLNQPMLNKGTAFSEEERDAFHLHGLLPPLIGSLEEQAARRLAALRQYRTPFQQYVFLRDLQDANETLLYRLLRHNIEEMLPLVYTPAVGEGCQRFSEIWHKPRGLFLSYPNRHRIAEILAHPRYDGVRAIVVSDGERILGLGDQGAGGMGIPIGKLALYTAIGGIHPDGALPILLDVGTDNQALLSNPLYIGWRHERVRGQAYDDFVETFVSVVEKRWPHVLLQFEDFAGDNAGRLLERYRDRLCTFNDDIQGTAAVAAGTLLSAINVTGTPLTEQRIALLGAGAAGIGICSMIRQAMVEAGLGRAEAQSRFYAVDINGLLVEGMTDLRPMQAPFVQKKSAVAGWRLEQPGRIGLLDVVANAKPTVLIGVSTQPGTFTETIAPTMARNCKRPVIFPLSNPTARAEATPADLMKWTEGRALIGTGSPFPPVERDGRQIPVDQTNNSYIFPGVALGVIASRARRVSDGMFMASAKALAALSPAAKDKEGRLLPPLDEIRAVSVAVAIAVARQAQAEGLAETATPETLKQTILDHVWEPAYRPYIRKAG
jgi:malate dehydrogenase (oxaloacetate-decarboxylating)